jgi:hypothetical protein
MYPAKRPEVRIGEIPLKPPVNGWWMLPDFPEWVFAEGRWFRRATWSNPFYAGVVAQYREPKPRDAMHLRVFNDWHYEIDHLDEDNPDRGRVVQHFFNDMAIGKFIRDAAPYVAVAWLAYLGVTALTRRAA